MGKNGTQSAALGNPVVQELQKETAQRRVQTIAQIASGKNKGETPRASLPSVDAAAKTNSGGFSHSSGKIDAPTLGERLKNVASGAGKQYASGYTNLLGLGQTGAAKRMGTEAQETVRDLEREIANQRALLNDRNASEADRESARTMIESMEKKADAYRRAYGAGGENEKTAAKVYGTADALAESGAKDVQKAKAGLGKVGSLAVDVGIGGAQLGADILLGLPTGGALLPMALRSAGGAAQEARQEGATHEQQTTYGMAAGTISMLTEKLSSAAKPLAKAFGKGAADEIAEKAIASLAKRLSKTAGGRALAQGLLKTGWSALGEGAEEMAEDFFDVIAKRMIYDPTTEFDVGGMLYDGLVGGVLGGVLGAGGEIAGAKKARAQFASELEGKSKYDITPELTDEKGRTWEQIQAEKETGESTSVNTDPLEHTAEEQRRVEDYRAATDTGVVAFAQKVQTLQNPKYRNSVRYPVSEVSSREAASIRETTGVDANGFTNILTGGAVDHIEKRHGANGKADKSMRDLNDLGRVGYILEHFDSAELLRNEDGSPSLSDVWKNSDGTPAARMLFTKKVDGVYYTAVATPDSNAGVIAIESAFMSKEKGSTGTVLNMENNSPQVTPKAPQRANASFDEPTVPQSTAGVNAQDMQQGARYTKDPYDIIPELTDEKGRTWEQIQVEKAAEDRSSPLDILRPEERERVDAATDALRRKLMQTMNVPGTRENRAKFREAANRIAEEWARSRHLPQDMVDSIFEKAWGDGVVIDDAFYNEYKSIKDHLRGQKITLDEADRADFTDWADFRKSTIGTLRIVNEGGLPVNIAYVELNDMAPELFPQNITHPADQLRRMAEVTKQIKRTEETLEHALGENAADFYAEKKSEFEAEVDTAVRTWNELVTDAEEREARRKYAEERRKTREEIDRRMAEERRKAREQRTDYRPLKTAEQMMAEQMAANEASYQQAEAGAKADEVREMLEELRRQAPQGPEKPETVRGTGAMDTLDIHPVGDQGDYGKAASLRGMEEAKRSTTRERRKAEERLSPTNAEKLFARGLADGTYQDGDIPPSMDREKVRALADYYYAEGTFRGGVQEQAMELREQNEALAKGIIERAEEAYRPMNMLRMNLNTPERVMRKSFGETVGEEINSTYFYPTQQNEAEKVRWINRMLDEVRTFEGRDGTKSELTQAERVFVQQIMEDRAVGETVASMELRGSIENAAENIRNGKDAKDAAKEFGLGSEERRLAERLARWQTNEGLLNSGDWDSVKIENAVEKFSKQYDLFYDAINDFLTAHGFQPIGFIKGYAPHMQKAETQNRLSSALKAMGVNVDVTELPTSISGRTADRKPGKRWVGNFLHRKGDSTAYDVTAGYENYVGKIADVFYHTDDIARMRGLERYLRKTYAPEELSDAIDHAQSLRNVDTETKRAALEDADIIDGSTTLSAEKMSEALESYISGLYDDVAKVTKYGEFVKYIDNYANLLAGKQSMADRGLEYIAGRTSLNAGNKLVSTFARAQVAGNLSSVLNQSSQLKDIMAEIPAKHITKAVGDICRSTGGKPWNVKNTEMFNSYDLLTGKKGIEYLTAKDNKADAVVTALFKPADIADSLVSALAVQSKYNQLISEGKTESEARTGADKWATSIMASRMKGSRPMIFESKNVVTQMISMFQVEAANSWAHLTQDLPANVKSIEAQYGKGAAQKYVAVTAAKGLLSAFLMNRIAEAAYGGTPASFDLLGYAARFISSGMGITVNEGLKRILGDMAEAVFGENIFGGDDDDKREEDREFDWNAAASDAAYDISNDIPFVRGVSGALGLGDQTLPLANIAEAVGGVKNALTAEDKSAGQIADAVLELSSTLAPGGRQLQKTYQGAKTMLQGGRTYGYGDKKRLQYPVEQSVPKAIQALVFGNSGLSETRDFYAGDAKGLTVKQTQAVQEMAESGADRAEVYDTLQETRGEKKTAEKMRILAESDLTDAQKLEFYTKLIANADSKRPEQFRGLMARGLDWQDITDAYELYAELQDGDGKASWKATHFASWADEQGFTAMQRERLKDTFAFYSQSRAEADRYEGFTAAGISSAEARRLSDRIGALEPESGKEQVSDLQRYRAVVGSGLPEKKQVAALVSMMEEGPAEKLEAAYRAGVSPEEYVSFREATDGIEADRDKNGKVVSGSKKEKVLDVIDDMDLTVEQKDALYEAAGYSKSTLYSSAPWYDIRPNPAREVAKSARKIGTKTSDPLAKWSMDRYKLEPW